MLDKKGFFYDIAKDTKEVRQIGVFRWIVLLIPALLNGVSPMCK
jgi:hypothetical protein